MVLKERDRRMLMWSNIYGFIDACQAVTWMSVGDRVGSRRLDWLSEVGCLQHKRCEGSPGPRSALSWTPALAVLSGCSTS